MIGDIAALIKLGAHRGMERSIAMPIIRIGVLPFLLHRWSSLLSTIESIFERAFAIDINFRLHNLLH